MAYEEETLLTCRGGSFREVYGANGFGYYTFRDTAEEAGWEYREGLNPLFVHITVEGRDATRDEMLMLHGCFSADGE